MKNNEKKLFLIKNGLSIDLITNLNESQVNSLYKRLIESKKEEKCACGCNKDTCKCGPECKKCDCGKKKKQETKEALTVTKTPTNNANYSVSGSEGKITVSPQQAGSSVTISKNPNGTLNITTPNTSKLSEGEVSEKSVSKKQQEFFGVVRAMQKGKLPKKGKAGEAADEMSKKDVKDFASTKHKGLPKRKETKEEDMNLVDLIKGGYTNEVKRNLFKEKLEKDINDIIESTLQPKMSKKDLINLIRENNPLEPDTEEETITKPKTPTKPEINPDFDPFTNPDPKDDPEAEGKDFFVSMAKDMGLIRN